MLEARVFNNSLRKLDALQELLDDPEISEIMVNGPKHIFYEKAGRVHAWNQAFASEKEKKCRGCDTSRSLEDITGWLIYRDQS